MAEHNTSTPEKTANLMTARAWLKKSLRNSRQLPNPAIHEFPDLAFKDRTGRDLAKCNAALAKVQAYDPK